MYDELARAIEGVDIGADTRALRQMVALAERLAGKIAAGIAAVETAGAHQLDGCGSITTWLTVHCRMSRPAAAQHVRRARALRDLPAVAGAVASGAWSLSQADSVTRTIDPAVHDQFTTHADQIIPLWAPLPVVDVADLARRWTTRALAAAGHEPEAPSEAAGMSFHPYGTDTWHGTIELTGVDGETVATALDTAIQAHPVAPGEPARTITQQRGQALVDICRHYLDHPPDHQPAGRKRRQRRGRRRPHVNVVTTLDDAVGGGTGRSLSSGQPVSHHDLLYTACDCTLHRVLTATDNTIISYGRARRVVPDDLFQLLVVRDQHCRWPGCTQPPRWCDAHHIKHWLHHGPTDHTNLVLLCRRHHRQLHQPGNSATLATDATLTITTPTGTHATRPHLALLTVGAGARADAALNHDRPPP